MTSVKIVWVRRLARFLGVAPAAFSWFMVIGYAFTEPGISGEGVAVVVSVILLTLAALSVWRWEFAGGIAEIIVAIGFGIMVYVTAGRNELIVATLLPLPWFVSGLLFLALDWAKRRQAL